VADVLYLFDGHNLLHAGGFRDPQQVVDRLAGFLALRGARGIVVFDGEGPDGSLGSLEVRYASAADRVLERLAAEHRHDTDVVLVSTDRAIRDTAGIDVRKLHSRELLGELEDPTGPEARPKGSTVADALEGETRRRLEEWRRGRA